MTHSLLALTQLTKRYPGTTQVALDHVSLSVSAGEVYGFLGANGAGKSTTIRLILNFILPTSGSITINGLDSVTASTAAKHHIGYLAGDVALYNKLTGNELLKYMSELNKTDTKYLQQLTKRFEAELAKPINELSKGNRQKLGIILAFMHQPEVLILDEPTSGLDPLMQEVFFGLVRETKQRGAAIFMSSHNFAEVERMCDRIGIIRLGKLVKEQTIGETHSSKQQHFLITFAEAPPLTNLHAMKNVAVTSQHGKQLEVVVEGDLSPLLSLLGRHHVVRLESQPTDLEREFLQFYGEGTAR